MSEPAPALESDFPIARCAPGRRRTARASLPEWQVAAEHGESRRLKFARHGRQQRRLAVRSGAVRKRDGVAGRLIGTMQESTHLSFRKGFDHSRCARETMSS